jgi:hypothetical protein
VFIAHFLLSAGQQPELDFPATEARRHRSIPLGGQAAG